VIPTFRVVARRLLTCPHRDAADAADANVVGDTPTEEPP
jgi:hypothetical protein